MLLVSPIGSEDEELLMTTHDRLTPEEVLAAFDQHLRRVRGVCSGTCRNYGRYAGAFVEAVFADGPVDVARISAGDVAGFVAGLRLRYQPRTVELAASALRSFCRFLGVAGLRSDRLEEAVPMVPTPVRRPGAASAGRAAGTADHVAGCQLTAWPAG
jgi:site-specific recombinase XerD